MEVLTMKNYDGMDADVNFNARIPHELRDDFRLLAKKKAINASEFVRQAMIEFIKEHADLLED